MIKLILYLKMIVIKNVDCGFVVYFYPFHLRFKVKYSIGRVFYVLELERTIELVFEVIHKGPERSTEI